MRLANDPRRVPATLRPPAPPPVPDTQLEPDAAARLAGLRYVNDLDPGLRRVACGKGFRFVDETGGRLQDRQALQRIRALAIPPAWTEVWICASEHGHIQATGRDARGRKQYIYHPDWVRVRDANKFARMQAFGRALGRMRRRVACDLGLRGMPRNKVLATIVRLLDMTLIRVGNREYARQNGSYGLTTLRARHVDVSGTEIRFAFRGKSGIAHRVAVDEARLARIVRRLLDLPGQSLFSYVDDEGEVHGIDSTDVNDYLHEIGGEDFSAKDFRTWYATLTAMQALERRPCLPQNAARKEVTEAMRAIARRLGNTPAICRKSYVHPRVIDAYLAGELAPCESSRRAPAQRLYRLLTQASASSLRPASNGRKPVNRS
jgi:DNA topoisomerase-1